MPMTVSLKRVYDKPNRADGTRVLVDRLWPRGLSKQSAAIDHWLRDLAPSNELRKWYHTNEDAWPAFRKRYSRQKNGCSSRRWIMPNWRVIWRLGCNLPFFLS